MTPYKQIRFNLFQTTKRRWRGIISIKAVGAPFTDLQFALPATDIIDLSEMGYLIDTEDITIEKREEENGFIHVTDLSEITLLSPSSFEGTSDGDPVSMDLLSLQATVWEYFLQDLEVDGSVACIRLDYQKPDNTWVPRYCFDFTRADIKFVDIPIISKPGTTEEWCMKKVVIRAAPLTKRLEIATRYDLSFANTDMVQSVSRPLYGGLKLNGFAELDSYWKDLIARYRAGEDVIFNEFAGTKAYADFYFTSSIPDGTTVTIDGKVYTFQNTLTNVDGHVKIPAGSPNAFGALENLMAAIGLLATPGTDYASATTAHPSASAISLSGFGNDGTGGFIGGKLRVAYNTGGTAGNAIAVSTSDPTAYNGWFYGGVRTTTLKGGSDATNIVFPIWDTTYYSVRGFPYGSMSFAKGFWFISIYQIFKTIFNHVGYTFDSSSYDDLPITHFMQKWDNGTSKFIIDEDNPINDIADIAVNFNNWFGRNPNNNASSGNTDPALGFSTPVTYKEDPDAATGEPLKHIVLDWLAYTGFVLECGVGIDNEPTVYLRERGKAGSPLPASWNDRTGLESTEEDFIPARPLVISYKGDDDKLYIPRFPKEQEQTTEIVIPARTHAWGDAVEGDIHGRHIVYDPRIDIVNQYQIHYSQESGGIGNFPAGWLLGAYVCSYRDLIDPDVNDNLPQPAYPNNFPPRGTDSHNWLGFYHLNIVQYKEDTTARTSDKYNYGETIIDSLGQYYANRLGVVPLLQLTRTFGRIDDDSDNIITDLGRTYVSFRNLAERNWVAIKVTEHLRAEDCTITFRETGDPATLVAVDTDRKDNRNTTGGTSFSTGSNTGGGGTGGSEDVSHVSLIPATDIRNRVQSQNDNVSLSFAPSLVPQTKDYIQFYDTDSNVNSGVSINGGFFTNIQQGFSLYEYGTGSYETGELRFYEQVANGTDYIALKAAPAMDDYQEVILPSLFPAGGNYVLGIVGIASNRITTEWVDPATFVSDEAVIKAPFNDTRNDILPTGDYTPLRILENTSGQTTSGFEVQAYNTVYYNSAKFDFDGKLTLGQAYGSLSGPGGVEGILKLAHAGGTAGGYTSISTQNGNNTNFTFYLPNEAPAGNGYLLYVDTDGIMGYTDPSSLIPSLLYWTESQNTSSPNATDYVSVWTPNAGSTHADAVLSAKGHGYIGSDVPDSTSTGGDKRGNYSVDWQRGRGAADQVVSGTYGFAGGYGNKVTGDYCVSFGHFNELSDDYSIAAGNANVGTGYAIALFGEDNQISGDFSFVAGSDNVVTGSFAVAFGELQTSAGDYSFTSGARCSASGKYSSAFGFYAVARNYAEQVFSSARVNAAGDSQRAELQWSGVTTNNSATELFLDGLGTSERAVLEDASTWGFDIQIVARRYDASENDIFFIRGGIKRDTGVGSTAIVGTNVTQQIGATSWTVTATADTTNGSLKITVTGENAKSIQWTVNAICVQTLR